MTPIDQEYLALYALQSWYALAATATLAMVSAVASVVAVRRAIKDPESAAVPFAFIGAAAALVFTAVAVTEGYHISKVHTAPMTVLAERDRK